MFEIDKVFYIFLFLIFFKILYWISLQYKIHYFIFKVIKQLKWNNDFLFWIAKLYFYTTLIIMNVASITEKCGILAKKNLANDVDIPDLVNYGQWKHLVHKCFQSKRHTKHFYWHNRMIIINLPFIVTFITITYYTYIHTVSH